MPAPAEQQGGAPGLDRQQGPLAPAPALASVPVASFCTEATGLPWYGCGLSVHGMPWPGLA